MKRIMYLEYKGDGLAGPGRIGWVEMTKSRRGYRYGERLLLKCKGYKYNCFDSETGEHWWVSGPKKNGLDRMYGGLVEIDDDARIEYWTTIRNKPGCSRLSSFKII